MSATSNFNDTIRRASGRPQLEGAEQLEQVGDVGIGRGGTAAPRQRQPVGMGALIRGAVEVHRQRVFDTAALYADAEQEALRG